MKIACLQFAPQVGDIDNNLNRADAVLSKASAEELDGLDLLVLPELAFTGYNFRSLQQISPFLEHTGSGITSLWARTTALKYDCTVVVGYPEKVDVSAKWPASPEYYNSALVVNGDGDTIANYRKSFLYYTDETWALEGEDGFFHDAIPGLGTVALGICTDLNPYKLEAPWDEFEFGYHVLDSHANVVILTMAWQTHQDPASFSRRTKEPDLETLVYWVQRLEPLIRAENEEEVLVVFCNRTGVEDEAMYTGTSAVLGVKGGEVFVYGVLGRGVKELLVVDTNSPPKSRLTNADGVEADNDLVEETALDLEVDGHDSTPIDRRASGGVSDTVFPEANHASQPTSPRVEVGPRSPRSATSPRLPWLAPSDPTDEIQADSRSPTRLHIPTNPQVGQYMGMDGAITDDFTIDSPELFSAVSARRPPRPHMSTPRSPWRFQNKLSPSPWKYHDGSHSALFGGGATMTPITPFEEDGWTSTPIDPKPPQWFWKHEPKLAALTESAREEEDAADSLDKEKHGQSVSDTPNLSQSMADHQQTEEVAEDSDRMPEGDAVPDSWADLAGVLQELSKRSGPSIDSSPSPTGRPTSTKVRNLSDDAGCSPLSQGPDQAYDGRESSMHDSFSPAPFRPASKAGDRPVMRSSSLYDIHDSGRQLESTRILKENISRSERVLGPRPPSRVRHAVFIPDEQDHYYEDEEEEKEEVYGYHSDTRLSEDEHGDSDGGYTSGRVTRGRQPTAGKDSPLGERWGLGRDGDARQLHYEWRETRSLNGSPDWPSNLIQSQEPPTSADEEEECRGRRRLREEKLPSPPSMETAPGLISPGMWSSTTSSVLTFNEGGHDDDEGDVADGTTVKPRTGSVQMNLGEPLIIRE